jgi:hypothetical protein
MTSEQKLLEKAHLLCNSLALSFSAGVTVPFPPHYYLIHQVHESIARHMHLPRRRRAHLLAVHARLRLILCVVMVTYTCLTSTLLPIDRISGASGNRSRGERSRNRPTTAKQMTQAEIDVARTYGRPASRREINMHACMHGMAARIRPINPAGCI